MIAGVARWGNSLALRIPAAFAREIGVHEGAAVDIAVADGALVVRPIDDTEVFDLDVLIRAMTEENIHGEITTGGAVGNEF